MLLCFDLLTLLFIKAFRQRMISCWHFTPITLDVVGETKEESYKRWFGWLLAWVKVLTSTRLCPPVVFLVESAAGPDHHPQSSAPSWREKKVILNIRTCVVEINKYIYFFLFVYIPTGSLSISVWVGVCGCMSVTWQDYYWVRLGVIPNSSVAASLCSLTSTPGCTWQLIWCFLSDFVPNKQHRHNTWKSIYTVFT